MGHHKVMGDEDPEEVAEKWDKLAKHFDEDSDGVVTLDEFRLGFKGFGTAKTKKKPPGRPSKKTPRPALFRTICFHTLFSHVSLSLVPDDARCMVLSTPCPSLSDA